MHQYDFSQSIGAQLKPGFGELRIAIEIHRAVALKYLDHLHGELEPGGSHLHFYEINTILKKKV
jgi:hypothetical protein